MSSHHPAVVAAQDLARRHGVILGDRYTDDGNGRVEAPAPARPVPLADTQALFQRHLYLPDPGLLHVVLGTVAANLTEGDPVWMLTVGPPGSGKTEVLQALLGLPRVRAVATITESALLSGTPKRDKAGDAKGGLLREIGDFGILILKDFGSVLSMNREARAAVLAALREVYDGSWTRHVGTDGGRTLAWSGKIGLLAGATPSFDQHHGVIAALGERFLTYRLPPIEAEDQARQALRNISSISKIRAELTEAVRSVLAGVTLDHVPDISEADTQGLIDVSVLAVRCRSAVERDAYRRDIELIPDPEAPGRMVGALARLWRGLTLIGLPETDARTLIVKIALDCMPATRRDVFSILLDQLDAIDTTTVAEHTGYPTVTARRILEDLTAHGVVVRIAADKKGMADRWRMSDWARSQHAKVARWRTFSEMSDGMHPSSSYTSPFTVYDDISGTPLSADTNADTKTPVAPDMPNLADTEKAAVGSSGPSADQSDANEFLEV